MIFKGGIIMFREIRTQEKITEKDENKKKEYLKIKPETERTKEELSAMVMEIFQNLKETEL
jgi:hypothetical protein